MEVKTNYVEAEYKDTGCLVAQVLKGKDTKCLDCPFIDCLANIHKKVRREYMKKEMGNKYKESFYDYITHSMI